MAGAIAAVVRQGDVVVEVGTGLGTYAIMAVQAGAARVYAIEPGRIADLTARVLAANDGEDRVRLLRGRVEEVRLPEQADVLITEDFAPWFFDRHLHEILLFARDRLVKEGGRTIPERIRLQAAPWGGPPPEPEPSSGESRDRRWHNRAGSPDLDLGLVEGIDFGELVELISNTPDDGGIPPGGLLAPARDLVEWDLATLKPGVWHGSGEWEIGRNGTIWGLGAWMEMKLADGIEYSNAPQAPEASWGQGHFPVDPPLEVTAGDVLSGRMEARSDPHGEVWWRWMLEVKGRPSMRREGNTFRALPLDPERSRALAGYGRLPVSPWAAVDALLLTQLADHPVEQAARQAFETFPELFGEASGAVRRAARLRETYLASEFDPDEGDEP